MTQGPCEDGSWLVLKSGEGGRSGMVCVARRFCHVDENGTCRRIIKIRNLRRRGDFEDWLGEFRSRTTIDESGECIPTRECLGDSLPWSDGKCYQVASRGPCEAGSWLVLDGVVNGRPVMKCELQMCEV